MYLNQRALTRTVSKTGLHPLDRCNEGMRVYDPLRHGSENLRGWRGECVQYMDKTGDIILSIIPACFHVAQV
jgi:hypothetical protein